MEKEHLEYYKATAECKRSAENSIKSCFYPGCPENSINSHILQKNGILSSISPNRHLWQLETNEFSEQIFKFQRRGLNEIFSFNCFCKDHDSSLFKKIEGQAIDFNDYESCLLFCLRTLYNEMFRKMVNIKHHQCIIERLPEKFDNEDFRSRSVGYELAINDLKFTENEIWKDLKIKSESFVFQYRELEQIEVCMSACYTYDTTAEMAIENAKRPAGLIINLFPYGKKSILIIGYHIADEKKVKGYVNCFFKEKEKRVYRSITNLMLFQCETWVCSEKFYDNKVKPNESLFYDIVKFSGKNYNERKIFDLNIMDGFFQNQLATWSKQYLKQSIF